VDPTEVSYYRVGGSGRPIYVIGSTAVILLIGVVLTRLGTASRPPFAPFVVFGVAYLLAGIWGFWFLGYRVPCEVGVGHDELVWVAPFRTRQVALGAVLEFRRARLTSAYGVLVLAGGDRLLVRKRKEFVEFAVTLGRVVPSLRISA
jgi:hypothetical protein